MFILLQIQFIKRSKLFSFVVSGLIIGFVIILVSRSTRRHHHQLQSHLHVVQSAHQDAQADVLDVMGLPRSHLLGNMSSDNLKLVKERSEGRKEHYSHTWISMPLIEANLLPQEVISKVKYFLFFVGHGRGGSSILGSLIDAHPNIVVATDYQLFKKWQENPDYHLNRSVLYTALYVRAKKVAYGYSRHMARGYSLFIENAFMGTYKGHIAVIGEKEAGSATAMYEGSNTGWRSIYKQIQQTVKVPVKMMQVCRKA